MISFFLGAGASKPFGYPTTVEFFHIVNTEINHTEIFNDLLAFLKKNNEIIDIELLLWELDDLLKNIESVLDRNNYFRWLLMDSGRLPFNALNINRGMKDAFVVIQDQSKELVSDINKLVYDAYWQECKTNSSKIYQSLFENHAQNEVNIFTTNYDLNIERAFSKADYFSDGFSNIYRNNYWHEDHYADSRIKLYKLHGSVDWKRHPDGRVYCVPFHDFTKHDDNVLLYPGFKGIPKIPPFNTIHDKFREVLEKVSLCVFIGFSFRDEHINNIVSSSLEKNDKLKLIIWNPVKPDMKFLKSEKPDRIFYYENDFGEMDSLEKFRLFVISRKDLIASF